MGLFKRRKDKNGDLPQQVEPQENLSPEDAVEAPSEEAGDSGVEPAAVAISTDGAVESAETGPDAAETEPDESDETDGAGVGGETDDGDGTDGPAENETAPDSTADDANLDESGGSEADEKPVYTGRHKTSKFPAVMPPEVDETAVAPGHTHEAAAKKAAVRNAQEAASGETSSAAAIDDGPDGDDNEDFQKFMEASQENPKKKMKKGKVVGIVIGAFVALLILVYTIGVFYFSSHFIYGTVISDVNCSFMTVPEVEKIMTEKAEKYTMSIAGREDTKGEIKGTDISLKYDAESGQIQKLLEAQGKFRYPIRFVQTKLTKQEDDPLSIEFMYDAEALEKAALGLDLFNESKSRKPADAYPEFDLEQDRYVIHPEDPGTLVDKELALEMLNEKARLAISNVDLDEEECYVNPKVTKETPELVERIGQLDKYTPFALVYEFSDGHTEQLNGETVYEWLDINEEDGSFTYDKKAVKDWVGKFAERHDRAGKKRVFKSVDGNTYEVSGGTYGWIVDQNAEVEAIEKMLSTKKSEKRAPYWVAESAAYASGTKPDWGDTYIELNIAKQHMYVVKDGKKIAEYDVVTGLPGGRETPLGVYSILEKMRNKTLRGERDAKGVPEYETPVSYWMRVTWSGVGFHDATWQPSFGGNRYTYAGSHGCINMSYSAAQELYGLVDVGTPVVIHYN